MKKICILSTVNIKHMTMLTMYTEYLEKNNIEYDIIYIDKYQEREFINAKNIYSYKLNINREWSMPRKLIKYYKFKKFAKDIIKNNGYDFIIVWNSFTAFMFCEFLSNKYKNKYCINIRDYAYEKYLPVYLIMKKVIKNSAFTTISSDGFRSFLPKYDYITVHSLNDKLLNKCISRNELRKKEEPIKITFIGYVRFFENDKKLIDALGNDNRFIVQFFGEGSQKLELYAKEKKYNNIICKGRFEPSQTSDLLKGTDIINNLYGVGEIALDTALSIKLYYAVHLNIPILVFKDTYMAQISKKYGIGYEIEKDGFDNLGNRIFEWYHKLNQKEISDNCIVFKEEIKRSRKNIEDKMREYLI